MTNTCQCEINVLTINSLPFILKNCFALFVKVKYNFFFQEIDPQKCNYPFYWLDMLAQVLKKALKGNWYDEIFSF